MGAIGKTYPAYLPPYSTVYWFYLQWRKECTEVLMRVLHSSVRQQVKKNRSGLRWWLLTHSWVKNTCNASIVSKGYCFYKSTNGIKRHLAVDTLGFPFFTHCTRANLLDDAGLLSRCWVKTSIISNLNPSIFPKIIILLDHGYHPEHLTIELPKIYSPSMTKIKFEISKQLSKQEKETQGKSGFVPVMASWVIERSNSWIERCKILNKNFERTLANATAKVNLCLWRLMVKRLAA